MQNAFVSRASTQEPTIPGDTAYASIVTRQRDNHFAFDGIPNLQEAGVGAYSQ